MSCCCCLLACLLLCVLGFIPKWKRKNEYGIIYDRTTQHSTQNHQLPKYFFASHIQHPTTVCTFNVLYKYIYVTVEHSFASSFKPYVFGWHNFIHFGMWNDFQQFYHDVNSIQVFDGNRLYFFFFFFFISSIRTFSSASEHLSILITLTTINLGWK